MALLALLAQATLPHLHLWLVREHASSERLPGAFAQTYRDHATAPSSVQLARSDSADDAGSEHTESRCPICKTLAATRNFLVVTTTLSAPMLARFATAEQQRAWRSVARPVAHAPRSPPRAA